MSDEWTVTEPGVYDEMPESVYHGDPVPGGSLSSTGARKLLPPSCPALFRYEQDHPRAENRTFDFGHVAHKLVLGRGGDVAVLEFDNYRTKKAQDAKRDAYAQGRIPILEEEFEKAEEMAAAVRAHPFASTLFTDGKPEQSVFAPDPLTGVMLRARFDWLKNGLTPNGKLLIADYKTAADAAPEAIAKSVRNYGYHQQDAWYTSVAHLLGLADDIEFVLVFQEKTAPYLVTVVVLDHAASFWGEVLNRYAIKLYRRCVESGRWPGYADDVVPVSLPPWAERDYEAAEAAGLFDLEDMTLDYH